MDRHLPFCLSNSSLLSTYISLCKFIKYVLLRVPAPASNHMSGAGFSRICLPYDFLTSFCLTYKLLLKISYYLSSYEIEIFAKHVLFDRK